MRHYQLEQDKFYTRKDDDPFVEKDFRIFYLNDDGDIVYFKGDTEYCLWSTYYLNAEFEEIKEENV